jgi:cupin superfamily acireductone dioxygenase involved in methionine salvage
MNVNPLYKEKEMKISRAEDGEMKSYDFFDIEKLMKQIKEWKKEFAISNGVRVCTDQAYRAYDASLNELILKFYQEHLDNEGEVSKNIRIARELREFGISPWNKE